MVKLIEFLATQKRLLQQEQEIKRLRQEMAALKGQNDSMREGMRRCVTCDYRIDYKHRQDAITEGLKSPPPPPESEDR